MFWFEDEIKRLEAHIKKEESANYSLFLGSGTITQWYSMREDLAPFKLFNAGYGGATISSTCWFFNRIVKTAKPSSIILFTGENDLGENRHPEEICMLTHYFIERVREEFKNIPITFVSIKPSPTRWGIIDRIYFTNEIIKMMLEYDLNSHYLDVYSHMMDKYGHPNPVYFSDDGLHLSRDGYTLWRKLIMDNKEMIFGVNKSN